MSYEDLMRLAMFDGNDDTALVRFRHAVKHARAADAQIAALTEKLRAVEAERDEARSGVKKSAEAYGALMEHAEKLRAELERKDAALKEERKYHEERIDVSAGLTLANHRDAVARIDLALQPKEPPCKS